MRPCPVCDTGLLETDEVGLIKCDPCGYTYNRKDDNPIRRFCIEAIEGAGGLDDYEYYEMATPTIRREIAVAQWLIRCLANPHDPLSGEVLRLIEERRQELAAQEK